MRLSDDKTLEGRRAGKLINTVLNAISKKTISTVLHFWCSLPGRLSQSDRFIPVCIPNTISRIRILHFLMVSFRATFIMPLYYTVDDRGRLRLATPSRSHFLAQEQANLPE
jgi:hypothetical protein